MGDNAPIIGGEAGALLEEARARTARAEEAQGRSALLADASAVLAESLDMPVVLERLAQLVVRQFAGWCVIDLVDDGAIARVAGAPGDPRRAPLLAELQRRFPPNWESRQPAVEVLRTGKPLVFRDLTEAQLRPLCLDDEHFRLLAGLGARDGLVAPLKAGEEVVGSISAGWGEADRRPREADLELVTEIARRAGHAIANARLYHQCQEAVRLRDEFLSVASHELNTPMAALMLSLEGLGATGPALQLEPAEMAQVARLAERQGKRLTRMIDNLLDATRLARGGLELHRESIDLVTLVGEVVTRYQPELERAGCAVTVHGPPVGTLVGHWDPMRMDQVVLNLLANAAKFGAGRPIDITLKQGAGTARLSVADRGIGVDPNQHRRIFERFERGVSARHYGGLGLGLYICRRIVEAHGGTIGVDSRVGEGATFTVELPLTAPPH